MYFLGIDVGTQGARAVVADRFGNVAAEAKEEFPAGGLTWGSEEGMGRGRHEAGGREAAERGGGALPDGWFEQPAGAWWEATRVCLGRISLALKERGIAPERLKAVAVTSTSGTIVPVDRHLRPLRPAIMYNDSRAREEAKVVQAAGAHIAEKLGYRFGSSFALPRILWLKRHEPGVFSQAAYFLHAADYIVANLLGGRVVTDYSNSLKTGYDLVDNMWPGFIEETLGIPLSKLPEVVAPGTILGRVSAKCAADTGLSTETLVVAGMTDGCAAQVAAGAMNLNDWNTTIGTTLVIKGVTSSLLKDPEGRIYSHKHPEGYWMPGGASNTGGECLEKEFHGLDYDDLNRQVPGVIPTGIIVFPLKRIGERFPFVHPDATGFVVGEPRSQAELYAGYLEGVGYVERLAYDMLEGLGANIGEKIYTTGGATKSKEWLQIRASILNRALVKPRHTGSDMGMAIVAASKTAYADICEATRNMVQVEATVEPRAELVDAYSERYGAFRRECARRGYFPETS